jgi:hypothetical protein
MPLRKIPESTALQPATWATVIVRLLAWLIGNTTQAPCLKPSRVAV